jgi:hypothetical protein
MIPARGAKLIEDARFVRTTGSLIAAVDADQRLAFGGQTHVWGWVTTNVSQRIVRHLVHHPVRVTFNLSQLARMAPEPFSL